MVKISQEMTHSIQYIGRHWHRSLPTAAQIESIPPCAYNNSLNFQCVAFVCVPHHTVVKKRIPLSVYLNLTYRCPNHCVYCNYPNFNARKDKELSTRRILKLIDEMAEAGCRKLHLTGGEPLIREDLGEIIHHVRIAIPVFVL